MFNNDSRLGEIWLYESEQIRKQRNYEVLEGHLGGGDSLGEFISEVDSIQFR